MIFFICDVPLGDGNAQNIHIMELFKNMNKVVKVYLFTPKPKKINLNLSGIKYVPSLRIPVLGSIFYQISLFHKLYYYCKKTKVNAIYLRQSTFTFIPLILSKHFRIPYFVEVNGLIMDEMNIFGVSKFRIAFTKLTEKLGYEHAVKIIAVTQGVKKGIIELYNIPDKKIDVIENGANIDLFRPMDQKNARKELKLNQDVKYICFTGHFVPWQGVEYLIQAAPLIIKACPDACFIFVGDGKMKTDWMKLTQKLGIYDKFNFTGIVSYMHVPLYINASDICVVYKKPIKSGFSPLKLYEYMACGKPVVASRLEGFEILEQQKAGILVNTRRFRGTGKSNNKTIER